MRTRLLQGIGVLSVLGGSVAIWYAFQRQMCLMAGGGTSHCSPTVVYLVPGVLAVLIGTGLLASLYRRKQTTEPSNADIQ